MRATFGSHLEKNFSFLSGKKLLVAVSGGLDSMVLCDLLLAACQKQGFELGLAHCNFKLRGSESDSDEAFVRAFAARHELPFYHTAFDTKAFADDYKLSTQQAARALRYEWFAEVLKQNGFDFVLTAHHADDNLETFLINLSRSSGIDGLSGIPVQNGHIIRPMLPFSRTEIEQHANGNALPWREDSSNASQDYLRNKIRQQVLPSVRAVFPDLASALSRTQQHLQQTRSMAEDASTFVFKKVAQEANGQLHIDLAKLGELRNPEAYLHHWLQPYGFTAWQDVYRLMDAQGGKLVLSGTHQLLKHRHFLILSPLIAADANETEAQKIAIPEGTEELKFPLKLRFETAATVSDVGNCTIFVDARKLRYPLVLRNWQEADRFQPSGMGGKSKKVSKFFKDEKLSLLEKTQCWLLCSDDEIVWVIGKRQDERFKPEPNTHTLLKITHTP